MQNNILCVLREAGLPATNATRNRRTGRVAVRFTMPDLNNPAAPGLPPVVDLARQVTALLPGVRVVDTHASVAAWRPGAPIIFATIFYEVEV